MAKKYKVPDRLEELGESALSEFHRLLIAPTPDVLLHLHDQHRQTCEELLKGYDLSWSNIEGVVCETRVDQNPITGRRYARCEWTTPRKLLDLDSPDMPPDDHWRAVVMLSTLVRYLGSDEGKAALRGGPAEGRERIHREVLRAWWFALAVPELHRRGVSIFQSENRKRTNYHDGFTHTGNEVKKCARKLREDKIEREDARDRLMNRYGFSARRANQILSDIGWPGRRGGHRKAKE